VTYVQFANANDIGDRFLDLLSKHDIQPPIGSALENELLSLTQLIEVMKNPGLAVGEHGVTILTAAAALHDFAAKVLSIEPMAEFKGFIPHLRLIAESKVAAASFSQNRRSAHDDDTARKMAELYCGCLAAHIGTEVDLDSPTNAKGNNPDVIFKVQEDDPTKQPQRWALAIKTISSKHGQTIFERIKEGAEQIERCPAEKGMVVINAKSALNHNTLWNTAFPDLSSAMDAMRKQLGGLADSADENRPQAEWGDVFSSKTVRPALFLGQSLVRLPTPSGKQLPAALKMLLAYGGSGPLDPIGVGLASSLNHYMQSILQGIPGGNGYPPR
jgi:hypothetical protein